MRTTIPIRAEIYCRDDPFELPAGAEVGQVYVVDGQEHVVGSITLRFGSDQPRIVKGEARMRPLIAAQPTRA